MLLQTIKSRNLWLWSEVITSSKSMKNNNKEKLQQLNEEYHKNTNEMLNAPESVTQEQQEKSSLLNAEIRHEMEKLENSVANDDDWETTSMYTAPFKITALQSVDVTWDNPVGESYGITANFLQSWHNKPVNITFKGISYMGAFGGNTVGNLVDSDGSEIKQASDVNGLGHIANNISAGFTSVAQSISKYTNSNLTGIKSDATIDGKYDVVIDQDVEKINNLLSNYGEGLYPQKNKSGSPYIYLLMENPGSGTNNSEHGGFVTFIGHIKNFTYSERVDKPFLYDYTVQFVGEPTLQNSIRGATIEAQKDASSVKLTVITSNSGYSLGYGW